MRPGFGRVEPGLEERDEVVRRGRVGQRLADRWHHVAAELLDDGFPDFGMCTDIGQRQLLERELARALGIVVAVGAEALDRGRGIGGALFGARLAARAEQHQRRRRAAGARAFRQSHLSPAARARLTVKT